MRLIDADAFMAELRELYREAEWDLREVHYSQLDFECNIDMMPTIEAEPRWIPVTERLPEKYGWYLCTLKDGRVNTYYWNIKSWVDNVRKYMFDIYEIRGRFTGKIVSPEEEYINWDDWVIAWMPLPAPYREVKE